MMDRTRTAGVLRRVPGIAYIINRLIAAKGSETMTTSRSVSGCLFCQMGNPTLNTVVIQNSTCYARWDNFPAAEGHLEVVPKRHVVSFFDLTPGEVQDAYELLVRAQEQITERWNAEGFTVGVNEGQAAGRTIDHLHIHLIPRYYGDVPDPRGGVRRIFPDCDPDLWSQKQREPAASAT
ncbi:HIT family protein [Micromonospora zhanjiangensis]|uniref:HIT family protein n=1 Tax=Micromonospora zhanjiangensis TaxID=1522057 RepID=A0ABV8KT61_9ACTN